MKREPLIIEAADQSIRLCASGEPLIMAADQDGKPPTFRMLAYNGGLMRVPIFPIPVVVDLDGLRITAKSRPVLADHDAKRPVGHTTSIQRVGNKLFVDGVFSGANESTREIVAAGKNGMPWQASIGVPVMRHEIIRPGVRVRVNGQDFTGPIVVARETFLKEVSVVTLGADDNSEIAIAARRQEDIMEFEKWLRASGWDPATLSDKQRATLEAAFKAETNQADPAGDIDPDAGSRLVGDIRAKAAEEAQRIAKISDLAKDFPEIRAQGIAQGWTPTKVELEVTRAQYATVGGIARPSGDSPQALNQKTVEAALMASLGQSDENRTKWYGAQTVEAADRYRGMGLKDMMGLCLRLDKRNDAEGVGFGDSVIQAAFSTASLPAITENVLNKLALMAYEAADRSFLRIAKKTSTRDFKQASRVRMLGTGRFERVGKAGELESGTVGEQKFTIQPDTYGQVLFIDRKTVRNDDLQILNDAATEMGNTGAEAINHEGFTVLLAATYFTSGNGNLLEGTANVLGSTGLNALTTLFRKQKAGPTSKAKDQRPINIPPRILLVPPELEVTAQILVGSADIRPGNSSADTLQGTMNPWRGRYEIVSVPHLSDSAYTGWSATAYYLLADPNRLPALEATFLDGVDYPRVERVNPPANQLGIGFRGYIDFGVAVQDPKGIAKATGVAAA